MLGVLLLLPLLAHAGAFFGLVVGLALKEPRWHAALAFFVPPLAVLYGWRADMKIRVHVYWASLALYAALAAVASART